jgi:protoporphyrinogen/coproporphyrinogen III oxidase
MHVVIVGGGISGLALAHALLRAGRDGVRVTVFEREARPGGVIRSERVDGYLCEHGPSGFLDRAPDTQALVDELDLRGRLAPSNDRARRRFIYRGGRLRAVPTGLVPFIAGNLLSWRGRLRVALEPFASAGTGRDESVHQFASRRFGREVADVVVDAVTTGIFGGSSRHLSIRGCFPRLWQLERDHGSILRGMVRGRRSSAGGGSAPFGRLVSLAGGMEELVSTLAGRVGVNLHLQTPVERIERTTRGGPGWIVHAGGGMTAEADVLVVATSATAAARLLAPVDADLWSMLSDIQFAPMAVLCLGFDPSATDATFDGFGFLVPADEPVRILGAMWESSIFQGRAPDGRTLVRVMMGGGRDPGAPALGDRELVTRAREDLRAICGVVSEPSFVRVVRQVPGLPQYTVGHAERLAVIEERVRGHEGLRLTGNSYQGLGVNACITNARRLAESLLEKAS